jgi:DNA invertase Pin-like site-specific DNA recombinase
MSPAAQQAAIERWAEANEVTIAAWHHEVISGKTTAANRPDMMGAIVDLSYHGAGVLVVAKRDRLARSVMQAAIIEGLVRDQGARVVCADGQAVDDGSPEAAFIRTVIDAIAEWERAKISQRTREALAVKKRRGERVGQVPYGWMVGTDGKTLHPIEAEQAIIAKVNKLFRRGETRASVAEILWYEGTVSRTGKRFKTTQIDRMLEPELRAMITTFVPPKDPKAVKP